MLSCLSIFFFGSCVSLAFHPTILRNSLRKPDSRCFSSSSPYEDHDKMQFLSVESSALYFREYVKRGLDRFKEGNFDGAVNDLLKAENLNSSKPISQLGIFLYCKGDYEGAVTRLKKDMIILEEVLFVKASDLRLWLSASYNKLGLREKALEVIDIDNRLNPQLAERRFLMNEILRFYAGDIEMDDMLALIGSTDESDLQGRRFFGNFYMGLYYDSINEPDLAVAFLSIAKESNRYPEQDLWFHLPKVLFSARFNSSLSSGT